MEQIKSALQRMHSNCYKVEISPANVYHTLNNGLWKQKVCAKLIHTCTAMTKEPCMFISPICGTAELMVMHSFMAF
jgi:hypothetical protein